MSLEAELLALAGDESDDEVKSELSPPPPTRRSPAPSSPKKRSRAPPKRSRKKARHDGDDEDSDNVDVKNEDDTLSDIESYTAGAASSHDEREVPMELASESEEDADHELYPLEGKYKDQDDKSRLLAMTEIDREAVLADRMAQIEREQQNRHLRNLLKSRNAADSRAAAAAAASTRKSLRTKSAPKKSEEATKRGKLDELRRTREERKATGRRSSFGDEDASKKMLSGGEEGDGFAEEFYVKDERPIQLDDVNLCRIGRTALAKLCDYPGFDQVVPDVFVRVSLHDKESNRSVYRMAQIKGFKTGKPYSMLEGARRTDKHLIVLHAHSERDILMDYVSDSRFTEAEFNRYKNQLEIEKIPLPTLSHIRNKAKALNQLATRPLTTEEIDSMIAKRKTGKADYLKSVGRRGILQRDRNKAVLDENESEIRRIDAELHELEDLKAGPARGETQMQRMARLNADNRRRNQAEVRKAEIAEKRANREALLKAESGGGSFANPFMRVKTMVKFRHNIHDTDKKQVAVGNSSPKETLTPPQVETPKANGIGLTAPTTHRGRKIGGVDDVIASMDLGIEIDI